MIRAAAIVTAHVTVKNNKIFVLKHGSSSVLRARDGWNYRLRSEGTVADVRAVLHTVEMDTAYADGSVRCL